MLSDTQRLVKTKSITDLELFICTGNLKIKIGLFQYIFFFQRERSSSHPEQRRQGLRGRSHVLPPLRRQPCRPQVDG